MYVPDDAVCVYQIEHAACRRLAIGHDSVFATDCTTSVGNEDLLQVVFCCKTAVAIDAVTGYAYDLPAQIIKGLDLHGQITHLSRASGSRILWIKSQKDLFVR